MHRKNLAPLLLTALPAFAGAQMYQCEQDGRTVFQDRPCVGGGEAITVNPASGRGLQTDPALRSRQLQERGEAARQQLQQRVTLQKIDRDIRDVEHKLRHNDEQMNAELQTLRERKRYAANNLAGATWQSSISQEMQALVKRYDANSTTLRTELERLHAERRQFTQ